MLDCTAMLPYHSAVDHMSTKDVKPGCTRDTYYTENKYSNYQNNEIMLKWSLY